ncbi:MAG: GNAT family N-acetyltransferase, partial [Planctomycetota bacterium]
MNPPVLCRRPTLVLKKISIANPPQAPTRHCVAKRVEVVSWDRLDARDLDRINAMRRSDPEKRSPFFANEFFAAVYEARGDVWVAVIEDEHDVIGYLPFHRIGRSANPVGRCFNDAHNLIAWPGTQLDWRWLLRACRVDSFDFHALAGNHDHLDGRARFAPRASFAAHLGDDSNAFLQQLEKDHRTIKKQEQKTRKMIRQRGPIRFELDCEDPSILETGIHWKRQQYRRTDILDLFLPTWTRRMIRILHRSESECRVVVSAMWAGDTLMAVHVGMVEDDLLHYWFPSYNVAHRVYSPGTALFKAIVRGASGAGIRTLDMGYGEQPYKRKQTDQITHVVAGCVATHPWVRWQRQAAQNVRSVVKKVPMKRTLKRWL